jgi:serine protease AprX
MADQVAGFPFWQLCFDELGQEGGFTRANNLLQEINPRGIDDLFVFSHGWNNEQVVAARLYEEFFAKMQRVADQFFRTGVGPNSIGVAGVIWPSAAWADEVVPIGQTASAGSSGGAAGLGATTVPLALPPVTDLEILQKLKEVFKRQEPVLDELGKLLTERPRRDEDVRRFQMLLRQLDVEPDAVLNSEHAADIEDSGPPQGIVNENVDPLIRFRMFADKANQLFPMSDEGGAASFGSSIAAGWNSIWNGAKEAARVATYWQMKKRAGVIGFNGLGPLLVRLNGVRPGLRIHLLGHSFGARLVSFALGKLPPGTASPVKSLVLIQAAFSHFAFAPILPHALGRGGALAGLANRVDGPIVVTHSVHDYAVGQFYPMASLTTNDDAAAFADPLFRYRAFGDDGAQAVPATPAEELHPAGVPYVLEAGKFLNLNGDRVIKKLVFPSGAHGDIIHEEIAWAAFAAAGLDNRLTSAGAVPVGHTARLADAGGGASLASPGPGVQDEGGVPTFPSIELPESAEHVPRAVPPLTPFSEFLTQVPEPAPTTNRIATGTAEDRLGVDVARGAHMRGIEDRETREKYGVPKDDEVPGRYIVELNLMHYQGLNGAIKRFEDLFTLKVRPGAEKRIVSKTYYFCKISFSEVQLLLEEDEKLLPPARAIYRIWPDFEVKPLIDRSVSTVKADAAGRSFDASGMGITWAVIDSGIDASHPHFNNPVFKTLDHPDVAEIHHDFSGAPVGQTGVNPALTDPLGHGTHVAGIIAGGLATQVPFRVFQTVGDRIQDRTSTVPEASLLRGVAPRCRLVSLRVLTPGVPGRSSNVIEALRYVREEVNGNGKILRIHGVNLSVGYEFDADSFACGQSPLCVEVDRLVRTGVVVVIAAGNTGYGTLTSVQRGTRTGMMLTINDPGNAVLGITVGSTHRDSPHTYGVSFFSSKGPTGDGRLKPDLVAPGERITSCASGSFRDDARQLWASQKGIAVSSDTLAREAIYVDHSGTSMAAPHVSGAIAAFLSIRREFIQKPDDVKRIFLESAMSLGRERYFEGHGMVDVMRAIQSV